MFVAQVGLALVGSSNLPVLASQGKQSSPQNCKEENTPNKYNPNEAPFTVGTRPHCHLTAQHKTKGPVMSLRSPVSKILTSWPLIS